MMPMHQASNAAEGSPQPRFYAEELTPSLQMALAALADIDMGYDRDLDRLRQEPLTESQRRRLAEDLQRRRREDREPYVRFIDGLAIPRGRAA